MGRPTSTFGGGGGTKLFCSQPPSAANAVMMTAVRAMAPCLMRPFGAAQADERGSFISLPQLFRFSEGLPQFKDSNNPLAVELERENDPGRETFSGEPL